MTNFHSVNTKMLSSKVGNTAEQQSFLGTTIESFNVTAGFGDSASTCTVNLATDTGFNSDGDGLGLGADVYHTGAGDRFRPPPIGTPVFFSYGRKRANVGDAFVRTIDDYYGTNYKASWNGGVPKWKPDGSLVTGNPGYWHFAFGGILQSYTENTSNTGGLRHTVTITDPREILANCTLILNNYGGTTFNNSNLINIYGFLEHNGIDEDLRTNNDPDLPNSKKDILNAAGQGMDIFSGGYTISRLKGEATSAYPDMDADSAYYFHALGNFGTNGHPMTGTGMSRRTSSGIPYYRVVQAYNYLMGFSGTIQDEYIAAGYGGFLKFRGLRYAVDLSGLPNLPKNYMIDFDAMSILDFCQEVCEVANHELFFTLLPRFVNTGTGWASSSCAGVIKAVTINKSVASAPGQIKSYINKISDQTDVTRLEVGYELTNETTDKVVTGGKEASMYYLPTPYGGPLHGMHHYHTGSPIVPYYGDLSPNVPTIPRGYGSFTQICLDAGSCQANGVGRYYIATEMELRVAAVSYEKWEEFLLLYNNLFMESIEGDDIQDLYYASQTKAPKGFQGASFSISNNYQVTVPRCTWPNHTQEEGFLGAQPKNPCHPPYGYPLYWGRARSIGIARGGATGVSAMAAQIINRSDVSMGHIVDDEMKNGDNSITGAGEPSLAEKRARDRMGAGESPTVSSGNFIAYQDQGIMVKNNAYNASAVLAQNDKLMRSGQRNAKVVYDFIKKVADECLGKKYLVQVPQRPNNNYQPTNGGFANFTATPGNNYTGVGPYGFPSVNPNGGGDVSINGVTYVMPTVTNSYKSIISEYLKDPFADPISKEGGGLAVNYNSSVGSFSFNYLPATDGGYYGTYGTPNVTDRNDLALEPIDNAFLRSDGGRTECYVRYCNSQNISFSNFDKGSYTQQFVNPAHGAMIPDITYSMENSNNPNDRLGATVPAFANQVTIGGQKFTPHSATAYVKAELDEKFYIAPPSKLQSVDVYGNKYGYKTIHSAPQTLFDEATCSEYESYAVNTRYYFPKQSRSGRESIYTINLDACYAGKTVGNSRDGVYALITIPDRAVPKVSTTFRDGMDMEVQSCNIKHYLQLDIVRGMPGISNQPNVRPNSSFIHSANDLPKREDDPLGVAFYQSAQQAVRKAYQGLGMGLLNQINIASPSPVVPDLVALPLISQERSYGPWTSFYSAYDNIGGKMEYIHDENLTPWNYGGYDLMDKAGKIKVQMGTSAQLMSERGSFNLPMDPSGITLARTLYQVGGPLVTDLSIKVDSQGIESAIKLTSYTASFGKLKKQREDQMKKMSREVQKQVDINNNLIRRNLGKSQGGFNYTAAINKLKKQLLASDFSSRNYSNIEKYGSQSSADNMNFSVEPVPSNTDFKSSSGSNGYVPGDGDNHGYQHHNSSLQSQESQNYANGLMSISPVQALKQYWNTASDKLQNMFTPSAAGWHGGFTVNPPEKPSPRGDEYGDSFDEFVTIREPEN